ncbi:MAG TPA: hypothetical protein VNU44_11785 [Bryobacteraceae bacterium]|nr:hypothetical protein [Bryobacteraceae bacterium]
MGQGVDQILFRGAHGLIEIFVGLQEGGEVFLGFAGEGVELGGEAVLDGVLGGAGFAFGRDGSF